MKKPSQRFWMSHALEAKLEPLNQIEIWLNRKLEDGCYVPAGSKDRWPWTSWSVRVT